MAAFSSPLVVPKTTSRTPDDGFEAPDLLPFEMSQLRSGSSPAQAFKKIVYLSAFLTRSEKRKVAAAFRSFSDRSSAESSPINMDVPDASDTLKVVGRSRLEPRASTCFGDSATEGSPGAGQDPGWCEESGQESRGSEPSRQDDACCGQLWPCQYVLIKFILHRSLWRFCHKVFLCLK